MGLLAISLPVSKIFILPEVLGLLESVAGGLFYPSLSIQRLLLPHSLSPASRLPVTSASPAPSFSAVISLRLCLHASFWIFSPKLSSSSLIFSLIVFHNTIFSSVLTFQMLALSTCPQSLSAIVSDSLLKSQSHPNISLNIVNTIILKSPMTGTTESVCLARYFCSVVFICLLVCLLFSKCVLHIMIADLCVEIV